MSITNLINMEELDSEWTDLIRTARMQGLSANEIRAFLRNPSYLAQPMNLSTNGFNQNETHGYLEAK
ncbi:anti-repressor SinI family protein [Paenibacillus sp. UNC451MF]|uniref:anti-repressor SinI family protein n=1 Tax=Paenibacillus sp. UNC451MF TaxID=1449063 RepID=UPI001E5BEE4A|nr:anti-repressor SinI family protein [Paenibacillus sp. UNC451MF]